MVIMKRYHLTSDKFAGFVEYIFREDILLAKFDMTQAEITEKTHIWLLKNLPRDLVELNQLVTKTKDLTITEVPFCVTFDMFWNKYDEKECSSKIRTKRAWDKMNSQEQAAAYIHITKYFAKMPFGTRKKYAETYLNAQLWNN